MRLSLALELELTCPDVLLAIICSRSYQWIGTDSLVLGRLARANPVAGRVGSGDGSKPDRATRHKKLN